MSIALIIGITAQIQRHAWLHLQAATQQSAIKTIPLQRKPSNAIRRK